MKLHGVQFSVATTMQFPIGVDSANSPGARRAILVPHWISDTPLKIADAQSKQ
jgi:hypothetical protein